MSNNLCFQELSLVGKLEVVRYMVTHHIADVLDVPYPEIFGPEKAESFRQTGKRLLLERLALIEEESRKDEGVRVAFRVHRDLFYNDHVRVRILTVAEDALAQLLGASQVSYQDTPAVKKRKRDAGLCAMDGVWRSEDHSTLGMRFNDTWSVLRWEECMDAFKRARRVLIENAVGDAVMHVE